MSFGASIRNRSAQADNIRSQLERNQMEISLQSTRNQINLQVQQSRIGLIQGKAQVEAAQEAVRLAQESRDAEQEKLREGLSTAYNVILKERDLVTAQYAEVQVAGRLRERLVAMDQATGTTLERNGIRLDDAVSGIVTTQPTPPYQRCRLPPAANPEAPAETSDERSARFGAYSGIRRGVCGQLRAGGQRHCPLRPGPAGASRLRADYSVPPRSSRTLSSPIKPRRSGAVLSNAPNVPLEVRDGKLRLSMARWSRPWCRTI